MQIGELRDRITWQYSTPTQDAHGEEIDSWANVAANPTVWANIKATPVDERFSGGAQQVLATLAYTVIVRYRQDLSVKMRGLYGSNYLYIENLYDPTGKREYLALKCREVQVALAGIYPIYNFDFSVFQNSQYLAVI